LKTKRFLEDSFFIMFIFNSCDISLSFYNIKKTKIIIVTKKPKNMIIKPVCKTAADLY